jgi:hypothetical protein
MQMSRSLTLATCAGAMLAGCAGTPASPPVSAGPGPRGGTCNAAPAQAMIGKQATPSVMEQARVASGAAMARVLHPQQVVTREFVAERLNLVVDGNGRITAVRCG